MDRVKKGWHNFGRTAKNLVKLLFLSMKSMLSQVAETAICMKRVEEFCQHC